MNHEDHDDHEETLRANTAAVPPPEQDNASFVAFEAFVMNGFVNSRRSSAALGKARSRRRRR